MDRLKQEWNDTRLPEEAYRKARNEAWEKITRPGRAGRYLIVAAAASALLLVAVSAWMLIERDELAELGTPPVLISNKTNSQIQQRAELKTRELDSPGAKAETGRQSTRSRARTEPAPKRERVVLNFVLPKSGARLIWIIDPSFNFEGGMQ